MNLALLLLALLGHAFLWTALVNRIHGVAMPRRISHFSTLACLVVFMAAPVWFTLSSLKRGALALEAFSFPRVALGWQIYLVTCWIAAVVMVGWWLYRVLVLHRPPGVLRFHRTRQHALATPKTLASGQHAHHFLVKLPGNQILHLDVTDRAIEVPRLAAPLDGLSIVHLSDFHFTGRVPKAYFEDVVHHSNELEPDLVVITGDLIDSIDCIDWIPDTFGKLTSRYGVYFILGNHDAWVDPDKIREAMVDTGLVDLGGRWLQIEVRGQPVVLAGNELPWLAPAADMTSCPKRSNGAGPLRIVLSHSPDQIDWAQAHEADLLLAGHTHGGQIRFPLIGAVLAPSREGVKFASGLFHAPPTIMHVSRGVSGELPVRLNCPPEMAYLVLHTPGQHDARCGAIS